MSRAAASGGIAVSGLVVGCTWTTFAVMSLDDTPSSYITLAMDSPNGKRMALFGYGLSFPFGLIAIHTRHCIVERHCSKAREEYMGRRIACMYLRLNHTTALLGVITWLALIGHSMLLPEPYQTSHQIQSALIITVTS